MDRKIEGVPRSRYIYGAEFVNHDEVGRDCVGLSLEMVVEVILERYFDLVGLAASASPPVL